MSSQSQTTRCIALVFDPVWGVLTASMNGNLPEASLPLDWYTPLEDTRRSLSEAAGCRLNLLRSTFFREPAAETEGLRLWAAELSSRRENLNRFQWTPPEEARGLFAAMGVAGPAAEAWLDENLSGQEPPFRQEWARPGWHARAAEWVEEALAGAGIEPLGELEQIRSWSISNLMRLPTSHGRVYFKAVPPYFACEPAATAALSRRYPDRVPHVLAVDCPRRWLLLREFDGPRLEEVQDLAVWEEVFRRHARLQADFVAGRDEIAEWGSLIRPTERLPEDSAWLLRQAIPIISSLHSEWPADLVDRLRASLPCLEERALRLAAAGVPDSLIHGDWHANNVHWTADGPIFMDWSDAAFAHPFFDLFTMFDFEGLRERPAERSRLLAVFLDEWRHLAPGARVDEAAGIAWAVSPLYHTISYARITLNVEPSAQPFFADDVARFLRIYLDRIEQVDSGTCGWASAS